MDTLLRYLAFGLLLVSVLTAVSFPTSQSLGRLTDTRGYTVPAATSGARCPEQLHSNRDNYR